MVANVLLSGPDGGRRGTRSGPSYLLTAARVAQGVGWHSKAVAIHATPSSKRGRRAADGDLPARWSNLVRGSFGAHNCGRTTLMTRFITGSFWLHVLKCAHAFQRVIWQLRMLGTRIPAYLSKHARCGAGLVGAQPRRCHRPTACTPIPRMQPLVVSRRPHGGAASAAAGTTGQRGSRRLPAGQHCSAPASPGGAAARAHRAPPSSRVGGALSAHRPASTLLAHGPVVQAPVSRWGGESAALGSNTRARAAPPGGGCGGCLALGGVGSWARLHPRPQNHAVACRLHDRCPCRVANVMRKTHRMWPAP
jgi:hypothetical protein